MGKRKRIQRIKVGELGTFIREEEERRKRIFGELVSDIMNEEGCSWSEAKKILKYRRIERAIAREFSKIKQL